MVVNSTLNLENIQLGFRNFGGEEGQYNKAGDRNFVVFLDTDLATNLERDGWNIKYPKPKEDLPAEDDTRQPYLQVSFSFKNFAPKIVMMVDGIPHRVSEEEVAMLDWADIEKADIVIRPYNWEVNGNKGVKAYLKALYVTIASDEFTSKYGL